MRLMAGAPLFGDDEGKTGSEEVTPLSVGGWQLAKFLDVAKTHQQQGEGPHYF